MPKIIQFEAPDSLGLRPTSLGTEATGAAARRVQGEYNEAAASREEAGRRIGSGIGAAGEVAVNHLAHEDISQGAPAFAGMVAGSTKLWDDTLKANTKPDGTVDPTTGKQFLEKLEPELEKFKSGFLTEKGQQWAEAHVDSFRQHMFEKTSADMMTAAGENVKIQAKQTINNLSVNARSDPSSLDFSLKTLNSSVDAVIDSSGLTGVAAVKARAELRQSGSEAIVKSAALGQIEKTGEVPEWTTDKRFSPYINGAELKQMVQEARSQQRLNRAEVRAAQKDREDGLKKNINQSLSDLDFATDDKGQPIPKQEAVARLRQIVKNNPEGAALERDKVHATLKGLEREIAGAETPTKVSQQNAHGFMQQIRSPDANLPELENKIYDSYGNGGLNRADRDDLLKQVVDRKTPQGAALAQDRDEFFKKYGPTIDTANALSVKEDIGGGHTQLGKEKLYLAEMDARNGKP